MTDPKLELRPDFSLRASGVVELDDIRLAPLEDFLGEKVEYSGVLSPNSSLRRAMNDPNSFKGDLKLFTEKVPFSLNFKSEKGTIDINNEIVKIQLNEIPVNLIAGPDKFFATEWTDALNTDFSKPSKGIGDYEVMAQIRMDATEPEEILRSFSIRKDSLFTRFVVAPDRQAFYLVHCDPETKFLSAFRFVNQNAVEGQSELREIGLLLRKDDKLLELNYNALKDSYDISGCFPLTERLNTKGTFHISDQELKESIGFGYRHPSFGKFSLDTGFNQPKDRQAGFGLGLNYEFIRPEKRK